jgi:hypothetical protein
MTRTFEIVQQIINEMDLTIPVEAINGNILEVKYTLHINKGSIVKDDLGNDYEVVSFVNNEEIEVQPLGNYVFTSPFLIAPTPYFLQGKWISANNEYLAMSQDTRKKTPLIWLVRGYEERHNGLMSSVKMEVEPLIFFLDSADFNNWLNEDHDKEAINPMYNLAKLFVDTVENKKCIKTLDSWKIQDEPRFGVKITTDKGNSKRILSDDLSGVGLRIPLKIYDCLK